MIKCVYLNKYLTPKAVRSRNPPLKLSDLPNLTEILFVKMVIEFTDMYYLLAPGEKLTWQDDLFPVIKLR